MSPFALMRRMTEEIDRGFSGANVSSGKMSAWAPAIEVLQREGNYIVRAELPGLKPEEVKVEIANDALTIQGERRLESEQESGGVRHTEHRYGAFYRAIPLPEGANADQARARFENGVLEVTMPAPEQRAKRREIPIQGGSSGPSGSQSGTSREAA